MALPEHMVRRYGIVVPLSEWEAVSCEVIGCRANQNGWTTRLLEGDHGFADQGAAMIRGSSYRYTEHREEDGVTAFVFAPGQTCFKGAGGGHRRRKPNARELYVVRDGRTGQRRDHTRPSDWVDDFANHQATLASAIERG